MTTRVAIQCDSGISPECLTFSQAMPTRKGARTRAYKKGWQRIGTMDICAKCHGQTIAMLK
jgi:cytochrome c553